MVALLVFIIFFGRKKTVEQGNGGKFFKDPARYIINIFDKEA